jgi:glycine/D-amino acid oxidase-like deaminating enzyme/nitrite reductase/ring-hydroxylating ferredoxin subunit
MPQNVQAERSISLWMPVPEIPGTPVEDSRPCDIVVIGAGMAGLSVAYEALAKGRRVTVLDRGAIASGMTARTTAHLASALDDFYHEFISRRGEEEAKLLHESLAASIDRIEQIVRSESIECDFSRCDGYLFLGEGDEIEILEKEIEACHQIGFAGVGWADRAPMPSFDSGRCLRFPNQARFHPLKYLQGLARAILTKGGVLRPHTVVESVSQNGSDVAVKTTNGQTILARDVVCAANSTIVGPTTLHTKMAPYRTYAMAFSVPKGAITDALYWDTLEAYHYVRLQEGDGTDFLIVGGEDHKTGEADDAQVRFSGLESWARTRFNPTGEITHKWSGQVLEPVDFAGFVGQHPDNSHIWLVTGDSGQGITNGAVAGLLIPTLMEAGEHPWRRLYDPARISLKAAGDFISENITAVKSMAEHLGGPLLQSEEALGPGEGGLIKGALKPVAAFRAEDGKLRRLSASCSHMGCTVHFNSFELCWDCPCHGSHFALDGEAINAPAIQPLDAIGSDRQGGQ